MALEKSLQIACPFQRGMDEMSELKLAEGFLKDWAGDRSVPTDGMQITSVYSEDQKWLRVTAVWG